MNILLTNDDGIEAPGLEALVGCFRSQEKWDSEKHFELLVTAPANEKSASSHSISLGEKLRVEEYVSKNLLHYKVHGTPADCVKFALSEIKDFAPDLIISGINQGANTGVSVYYSGTISAAREGLINRVPSMAVSLCSPPVRQAGKTSQDFSACVSIVSSLVEGYRASLFPLEIMLNVNVPALNPDEIKGIKITKQAASHFIEEFVPQKAHDGKKIYTLAGQMELYDTDGASDEEAVAQGFISVTPLKLDLTHYESIPVFEKWVKTL